MLTPRVPSACGKVTSGLGPLDMRRASTSVPIATTAMPKHSCEQAQQLPTVSGMTLSNVFSIGAKCSNAVCIVDFWVWMACIDCMSKAAFRNRCFANTARCWPSNTKCLKEEVLPATIFKLYKIVGRAGCWCN